MSEKKSITLLVPVFNEEETILPFLEQCHPIVEKAARDQLGNGTFQILFVDDGSRDATASVIRAARTRFSHVALVRFSRNFGKEAALAAGFQHASGDAVIPIDVDLQDPPDLIPQMVTEWLDGAEIVTPVRSRRDSDTAIKRMTSRGFYRLYNLMADVPIKSDVGDFRLLDRVVVDALNRLTERVRFTKGLYSWIGFESVDLPFERPERVTGTTKWRYRALWRFALDGLLASTTKPLRIWSYFGLAIGASAILYGAFVVARTLIFGVDVPGYASLLTVMLFLGGLNLLSLGIMGEYIGRISNEVRERPLFVVRESVGLDEEPGRSERG